MKLNKIFKAHMVFAANKPIRIFGDGCGCVEITFNNKTVKYILNTNSKKIHYADCEAVSKMSAKNKEDTSESRSELIAKGYSPCGICEP